MVTIELQSSNMLKAKYDSVLIANFYEEYIQKSTYPHLYDNAKRVMCMFGSTYCSQQLFPKTNYANDNLSTRLSDRHLNDIANIVSKFAS